MNVKLAEGLNIWQYILWELLIHLQATYTLKKKLKWLPAKFKRWKLLPSQSRPPAPERYGDKVSGSGEEGKVQRWAAQQPSKTIKDPLLQQEHSSNTVRYQNTGPHEPFRYRGKAGDEDEKGAVALEGNLWGAPRGVWIQETVHRPEPGRQQ